MTCPFVIKSVWSEKSERKGRGGGISGRILTFMVVWLERKEKGRY